MKRIKILLQDRLQQFITLKAVGLTLATIIVIGFIANLAPYKAWHEHLHDYVLAYETQKEDLSVKARMRQYYGDPYILSDQIRGILDSTKIKNALVLFPPNGYCERLGVPFRFPEPAVFYYYTGKQAVFISSPFVMKATHLVRLKKTTLELIPVTRPEDIVNFCRFYKQFESHS